MCVRIFWCDEPTHHWSTVCEPKTFFMGAHSSRGVSSDGWNEETDDLGRRFWHNRKSGETTFSRPGDRERAVAQEKKETWIFAVSQQRFGEGMREVDHFVNEWVTGDDHREYQGPADASFRKQIEVEGEARVLEVSIFSDEEHDERIAPLLRETNWQVRNRACCFLLFYDAGDRSSFERIAAYRERLLREAPAAREPPFLPEILLVGYLGLLKGEGDCAQLASQSGWGEDVQVVRALARGLECPLVEVSASKAAAARERSDVERPFQLAAALASRALQNAERP